MGICLDIGTSVNLLIGTDPIVCVAYLGIGISLDVPTALSQLNIDMS